jgi:hypothetical protein
VQQPEPGLHALEQHIFRDNLLDFVLPVEYLLAALDVVITEFIYPISLKGLGGLAELEFVEALVHCGDGVVES